MEANSEKEEVRMPDKKSAKKPAAPLNPKGRAKDELDAEQLDKVNGGGPSRPGTRGIIVPQPIHISENP